VVSLSNHEVRCAVASMFDFKFGGVQRRLLYILPPLGFLALAALFWVGLGRDPGVLPSALIDQPVPEFDLPPLKDDKPGLASADLTGEVSLVNVFASWCIPCRVEHPIITRLAERDDVAVFGLNYKDKPEDAKAWLAELGDPYDRIGADRDGRVGIDWGVYGVPETFVVGRDGRIRYKHVGPLTAEAVAERILPLVEELRR